MNFSRPKSIDQAGRRGKRKLQDAVAVPFNFSQIASCSPESGLFMSSCSCFFSSRDAVVSIDIRLSSDFLSATFNNEFDPISVPAWSMTEKEIENWEGRVKYQFKAHEAHEIIIYNFDSIFGFSNRNNETRENFH